MNTEKIVAVKSAQKALADIEMWDSEMEGPYCKYVTENDKQSWLVSYGFLAEDFGRDSNGRSRYQIIITVDDLTGKAITVISKGGFIILGHNQPYLHINCLTILFPS